MTGGPATVIVPPMDERIDIKDPAIRARVAAAFHGAIPHNAAIGLEVVDAGGEQVVTRIPYQDAFLGDPIARLWHTSIATTAADSSCGLAVFLALPDFEAVATLDLRMDYLRPAVADAPLNLSCRCYHVTSSVAFARATVYQDDIERPTALCTATFMRLGVSVLPS